MLVYPEGFQLKFLAGFFLQKISSDRLALVGMTGGRAASTIRFNFWLKFCFLTINRMCLNAQNYNSVACLVEIISPE